MWFCMLRLEFVNISKASLLDHLFPLSGKCIIQYIIIRTLKGCTNALSKRKLKNLSTEALSELIVSLETCYVYSSWVIPYTQYSKRLEVKLGLGRIVYTF